MSFLSRMPFSKKIFLAIFGTATLTALLVCGILYGTLSSYRHADFVYSYVDHMNLLTKSLDRMEESQARIALNAVKALQLKDQIKPLAKADLESLVKELGVNEINVYDNEDSLLEKFPDLEVTKFSIYQSSLMRGSDNRVGHHTVMASRDNKHFIEAVIYFDDLTQLLREMAEHDADNLSIEMIGPDNDILGHIQKAGFQPTLDLQKALNQKDGTFWHGDQLIVLTSMQNEQQETYRFVATISTKSLIKELRRTQVTFLIVALGLIFVSWWLSRLVTTSLLQKVEFIRGTLTHITQTQDYSKRVSISSENSEDEIDDLGKNLNVMLGTLQSHQAQLLEAERDKARSQVAAQVAHDIRSPLMSMNMALSQIESSQLEPLAIIKSAVARIAGIVQKLSAVSAAKKPEEPVMEAPKLTLVEPLIASVFNEHLVRKSSSQSLTFQGASSLPHIWSVVQVSELQTALSNIINNAFEAGATNVALILSSTAKEWTLEVKDNGKGIPSEILEKIFERSFTFGKKSGTGLGLFQAKAAIEWSGGTLEVKSAADQGSSFILHMPREKNPIWLPAFIELDIDQPICFVDDDPNVLNAWRDKVVSLGLRKAHFFGSLHELTAWSKTWPETAVLVIDQNLDENKKGLEFLSELGIGKRAYLCTSEFDEKWIQDQIRKLNGFLIPKPWISQFELKVRTS